MKVVHIRKESSPKKNGNSTQASWQGDNNFKISDTDGTVLVLSDLLKGELRNVTVESFDGKRDETVNAMEKQPRNEILENLCFRQLEERAAFTVTCVEKTEPKSCTKPKTMEARYLEHKVPDKAPLFSLPFEGENYTVVAAINGKGRGQGEEQEVALTEPEKTSLQSPARHSRETERNRKHDQKPISFTSNNETLIKEEITEVIQVLPQEHIQERTAEQTVAFPVSPTEEEITGVLESFAL